MKCKSCFKEVESGYCRSCYNALIAENLSLRMRVDNFSLFENVLDMKESIERIKKDIEEIKDKLKRKYIGNNRK